MAEDDHYNPHHPKLPLSRHDADDESNHFRARSEDPAASLLLHPHGISINFPDTDAACPQRPLPIAHTTSAPVYASPIRHHRRAPSKSRGVKETLNARSHYGSSDDNDGVAVHRINQYIIKQEIGRGSFGAVHLAVDQFGNEYAVKEFSKSRLRKRAQSNLLRKPTAGGLGAAGLLQRPAGHLHAGAGGYNSPLHRLGPSERGTKESENDSLSLIKEEIAIMKKLDHNNLVALLEVLDDPQEDSLYMVMEYCKKGVVMKVGLDERAEPYGDEACRCWFRDMILGIEYLHHQGIIHRDIKPDNCLITEDDVLKIVDFGVSEMFEKESDMATAKSAGSPAFMPPELCVARHGAVSGRAADIWSMGVTLYCLRYGHIPFEKTGMLELYESIRCDDISLDDEHDPNFVDLMRRILEKDPEKRITMEELRSHPWVTQNGTDPLLSAEENCADLVEPPTEAEMRHAITGNMAHLLVVMKAVRRFKDLLVRKRGSHAVIAEQMRQTMFGEKDSMLVAPPGSMCGESVSEDNHNRRPFASVLVTAGTGREKAADDEGRKLPADAERLPLHSPLQETARHHPLPGIHGDYGPEHDRPQHHINHERARTFPTEDHLKGHAHDPLTDTLFLSIGADPSAHDNAQDSSLDVGGEQADGGNVLRYVVSESPQATEENIYEQAYQKEMKRIMHQRGEDDARIYLNRRVEHREDLRRHNSIIDGPSRWTIGGLERKFRSADLKDGGAKEERAAESQLEEGDEAEKEKKPTIGGGLAEIVQQAKIKARGTFTKAGKQDENEVGKEGDQTAHGLDS
ncbi:hypothetical protein M433DRAFT_68991 [Acidomyces richmondensis BFW]|nr:MAG: hypothetical protein FE78DRAFT_151389 [Acidomyces sp. 'richmondensis']KYG44634.1 hypothetical protein M433DRAFT_68991 [Acidomyces richmondensis BFW]